jgi:hypothetical protein
MINVAGRYLLKARVTPRQKRTPRQRHAIRLSAWSGYRRLSFREAQIVFSGRIMVRSHLVAGRRVSKGYMFLRLAQIAVRFIQRVHLIGPMKTNPRTLPAAHELCMLPPAQGNLAPVESVAREIQVIGTCRRDDGALPPWLDIPVALIAGVLSSISAIPEGRNVTWPQAKRPTRHDNRANFDNQILGRKHGLLPSPPQEKASSIIDIQSVWYPTQFTNQL